MGKNIGPIDKGIRVVVALLIIGAYLGGMLPGIAGLLLVVSGALLSSVMSGHCPLYVMLGVNTNK